MRQNRRSDAGRLGKLDAALAVAALLVAVVPVWAAGQSELPRWVVEVRACASSPEGDIGDASDLGERIAAAVDYCVSPAADVSGRGT